MPLDSAQPRHVVVSGGGSPIGSAIVKAFLADGARVSSLHSNAGSAKRLFASLGNDRLTTVVVDLTDLAAVARSVGELTRPTPPHVLIHAAGVWHDRDRSFYGLELADIGGQEISRVLDVGLRGGMLLISALLPSMRALSRGKVVLLSCGFSGPEDGAPWAHYYVANQGIDAMARVLAAQCRPYNVQVNCVSPWFVDTPDVRRFFPGDATSALTVEEVVAQVVYLSSPLSQTISGQVLELRSPADRPSPNSELGT